MSLTQINKAGLDEIALDHVFTIGASGSSAYTFQGEGLNGTVNNPTLYLTRGKTYRFENGSGGHPIRIQSTSGASGTAYNTGVTNNAGSGTVIVEVQHDAPDVLYYQCTSHAAMNGILYITGALADGGVTTAKIADNSVIRAKLVDNSVNSAKLATDAVQTVNIGNAQVTTTKIADSQVTTAKINDGAVTAAKIGSEAVTNAKIQTNAVDDRALASNSVVTGVINNGAVTADKIGDEQVTLAKLPHGTSSNDGKFLRANNGADPTFETVNTDLVSDTSPQLGGALSTNGHNISFGDGSDGNGALNRLTIGGSNDLQLYHNGTHSFISNDGGAGNLVLYGNGTNSIVLQPKVGENSIIGNSNSSVDLYYDNSKKFETQTNGVSVTGYLTQSNVPSFRAGRQSSTQSVSAGDTIIFNQASGSIKHFNQGNHYSTSTGRFTAPVAGVYSFWALIIFEQMVDNTNMADSFDLYVNNSQVAYSSRRAYADDGSTMQSHYWTDWLGCTLKLSANDYVYCKNKFDSKTIHDNDTYTTFQGFLVG